MISFIQSEARDEIIHVKVIYTTMFFQQNAFLLTIKKNGTSKTF
jgi:hypothetical protein